ncbi:hypothetical protein [Persephonella sp.]
MKIVGVLFIILIFLYSCERNYSKVFDSGVIGDKVECVSVKEDNPVIRNKILSVLKKEGFILKDNCQYVLEVEYKLFLCSENSLIKTFGADFDGYMMLKLLKNGKAVYMCQIDWKGKFSDEKIVRLVKRMKEDLKIKGHKSP